MLHLFYGLTLLLKKYPVRYLNNSGFQQERVDATQLYNSEMS